jgi:hypothetical protein
VDGPGEHVEQASTHPASVTAQLLSAILVKCQKCTPSVLLIPLFIGGHFLGTPAVTSVMGREELGHAGREEVRAGDVRSGAAVHTPLQHQESTLSKR